MIRAAVLALALTSSVLAASPAPIDDCCSYPSLPARVRTIAGAVPHGWRIEARAGGDVGENKVPVVVLILRDTDPRYVVALGTEHVDTNPRMLVVEIARLGGDFSLAAQNEVLIPRLNVEELKTFDYELGEHQKGIDTPAIEIAGNSIVLRLNESMFVGPNAEIDRTFKFQFRGGKLALVGYDVYGVTQRLEVIQRSFDYLNRKVKVSRGASCAGATDIVAHCRFTTSWKDLPSKPMLSIEQVGDGLKFEPNPNVF